MKNSFLLTAMALTVLASCSNENVIDVNKGNNIFFRTSLDRAVTRSNVTKMENLKALKVTAIGNNSNYFTNLDLTLKDGNWTTASTYYWPSYGLEFFAYAPQAPGGTVSITSEEKKITGFSPEQDVKDQKDFVVSYKKGTKAANQESGVSMNFKHALSQIEVKAKSSNDKMKVEVIGVKLVNAAAKADFTFPEEETSAEYELKQDKWSNWSEKDQHSKAYMIKGKEAVTLDAEAKSLMFGEDNFMLIPQKSTKWAGNTDTSGAYLSVLCRISNLDNGNPVLLYPQPTKDDKKEGKYAFSAVAIDIDWKPGKKYTYTLNFFGNGGGAGKIDPNPTDPTDPAGSAGGSDGSPDKPAGDPANPENPSGGSAKPTGPAVDSTPIPGGKGGDPILGAPIKFTVTVDEWTEKPTDVNML